MVLSFEGFFFKPCLAVSVVLKIALWLSLILEKEKRMHSLLAFWLNSLALWTTSWGCESDCLWNSPRESQAEIYFGPIRYEKGSSFPFTMPILPLLKTYSLIKSYQALSLLRRVFKGRALAVLWLGSSQKVQLSSQWKDCHSLGETCEHAKQFISCHIECLSLLNCLCTGEPVFLEPRAKLRDLSRFCQFWS